MLRIGVIGKILRGKYKGWYILIKPDVELEDTSDRMHYVYLGKNPELKGGIREEVYNTLFPDIRSAIGYLEQNEIIDDNDVNIEWLENADI